MNNIIINNGQATDRQSFLGTGFKFPMTFSEETNQAEMSTGLQDIVESIHILINTTKGERIMRPRYGSNMDNVIFEPLTFTRANALIHQLRLDILEFEPRVTLETSDIDFIFDVDEGKLDVSINITVIQTNTRTNIVFPFYLNEGTDIPL